MRESPRISPALEVFRTVLLVLGLLAGMSAAEAGSYQGRRLVDVLIELQDRGLNLIYSSAVVGDDLRVKSEPLESEPRALLDEILLPLGLRAEEGPGGSILILPETVTGTLFGRVLSVAEGRPIVGATIRLEAVGRSVRTDQKGSYTIEPVPVGTYEVEIRAAGFSTETFRRVRIEPGAEIELNVELKAQSYFVTEVVVTPNRHSVVREEQAPSRTVTGDEAVLVPTIGGDISRVVEVLPGVAAPDNSAAFNIRGSVARDVSMVLDGLELYDSFHLQSFHSPFSVIDSNVVDKIDFFGGGYTADMGDRHGGFVEISTKEPGEPYRGELELGTLSSRVSYQSPVFEGAGAWMLSTRLWYPEALLGATELGNGENIDPRFGDIYGKLALAANRRHRLSGHLLYSIDDLEFQEVGEEVNETIDARTRNGYLWFRLLTAWSPMLTSETVLSGGRINQIRDGLSSAQEDPIVVRDERRVSFYGLKNETLWQLGSAHVLKGGFDVRRLGAKYRYANATGDDPDDYASVRQDPDGTQFGVYAAYRASFFNKLAAELGIRWDRQDYTEDNQLSPRFNLAWRPSERSKLRLALGRFHQSQRIHELQVMDLETEFRPAETSKQAEVSFQYELRNGLQFRVDAYYRKLSDLRPRYENLFEPVDLFPETAPDRVMIAPDEAYLRGIELLLRSNPTRPLFWWAAYTRSSAEDLIDRDEVPRSWDQPHAGRFLVGYRRGDRWSVSLTGSLHTGWPTTPATGEVVVNPEGQTEVVPVLGERNSARFPYYGRLDVKARKSFPVRSGRLWLTLDITNVTDRDNACCVDEFRYVPSSDSMLEGIPLYSYWLGITPQFSVLWEF